MKFKLLIILILSINVFVFESCTKEELSNETENTEYYSNSDIQKINDWIIQESLDKLNSIDENELPVLDFNLPKSNTSEEIIDSYVAKILFENDDVINGELVDYSEITESILLNMNIDSAGRDLLFSLMELSEKVLTSSTSIAAYQSPSTTNKDEAEYRTSCGDCSQIYSAFITYRAMCNSYGSHYCYYSQLYFNLYISCTRKQITCPPGFNYDGANCHSGIYFPNGYNPFIYKGAFYTQQNCSISTANNCCPNNFGWDWANCHSGKYYPSNYEPFIYANAFYVKPKCQ